METVAVVDDDVAAGAADRNLVGRNGVVYWAMTDVDCNSYSVDVDVCYLDILQFSIRSIDH